MKRALPDKRLSARYAQLREQLSKQVGQSIPQASGGPHEAKVASGDRVYEFSD
jgi:hypothetical protein